MPSGSQELFQSLRAQYIGHGFPSPNAWAIPISDETQLFALDELAQEGLVEPLTHDTYKLTEHAVKMILRDIPISPQAEYLLLQLRNEYVKAGFPNHHAWAFSPGAEADMPAFQELSSRGWIEPFTFSLWRLTDAAVSEIISQQPMSQSAQQLFENIRSEYLKAGQPHWRQWMFGTGDSDQAVFDELTTRGILERVSLGAWRLTPYGYRTILG